MIRTVAGDRVEYARNAISRSFWAGLSWLMLLILPASVPTIRGDEFGALEGARLFGLPGATGTRSPKELTYRDLEALPAVLRDERSALVIVKTDQGNLAKVLLSGAFKKLTGPDRATATVPVLVLERFETIDSGDKRSFKARGKGVTLFGGFQFDLDSGQVVPDGAGGDIRFSSGSPGEPSLRAVSDCRLYVLEKPPAPAAGDANRPSVGRAVVPGDFGGRFNLMADGQWSGRLDVAVDLGGAVTGFFRSERNGSSYPVTGRAGDGSAQRIRFEVQFPRAEQSYDGLIWSEGKNVIAGTVTMLDHPYSFVAIREGASLDLSEKAAPAGRGPAEPSQAPKR